MSPDTGSPQVSGQYFGQYFGQYSGLWSGRGYCGAYSQNITSERPTVAVCRCDDGCRWAGSPRPGFASQPHVPLGVLDQAANLAAHLHCHADKTLPWVHPGDGLPRDRGATRPRLSNLSNLAAGR